MVKIYVSQYGSDEDGDGTPEYPFASINRAVRESEIRWVTSEIYLASYDVESSTLNSPDTLVINLKQTYRLFANVGIGINQHDK